MLGVLILAGNAHAGVAGTAGGTPSTETAPEGTPTGGAEHASEAPTEGTVSGGGEKPSGETSGGTVPTGETPPQEAPKGTPPVGGEPPPQEAPKVAPPVGGQPPAEEAPKGGPSAPGAEHSSEEAAKGVLSAPGEHSSEGAPTGSLPSPVPPPVVPQTPSTPQDAVTSGGSGREAPLALTVSLAGPFNVGGQGAGGPSTDTGAASAGAAARMIAAHRLGELSCQLSGAGGRTSRSCAAAWLVAPRVLSDSPLGLTTAASLAAAVTGDSPTGGGRGGGSGMGNAPVSPTPGPAPSGASGSMTGGSGTAPLTFLTLAGLLLLAAPRAMRRLRLSCQPWLTACFVLIPERPG
jgi:hypothetical protein